MKQITRFLTGWLLAAIALSTSAATVTINSVTINRSADINLDNGLSISIDDAGGTPIDVVTLDSNDDLALGKSTGVDNVTIDFEAGGTLVIDGALTIDAGVITGATSITSTAFVGGITGAITATTISASGVVNITNATEATDTTTASLKTAGGLSTVKDIYAGDDIFFTTGAVLNFNAGAETITHATNKITVAGGDLHIANADGLIVGAAAQMVVGGITSEVEVLGTAAADSSIAVVRHSADTTAPTIEIGKSRGAVGAFDIITTGDVLGSINFWGADGVDLDTVSAAIIVSSTGTIGAGRIPTTMGLYTSVDAGGSAQTLGLLISATQDVTISNGTLTVNADITAGDNATLGYTAAEGLILTGQGTTNDITFQNDAAATVVEVATGTVNVEFTAGNLIVGTAGKGVDFSITTDGAGTATSELLDDYEEGTCTLLPSDAASAGNTATPAAEECFYTVVGRLVTVIYTITDIDTTGMTGGNDFFVQGMPYANNATIVGEGSITTDTVTYDTNLTVQIATGVSAFRLAESKTSAAVDYTLVSNLSDDTSDISGVLTYMK